MCDGLFGSTKGSIINFLVYYDRMTIFHTSIDASNKIHDSNYILSLMRNIINEIGEEYIIQVIIDNTAHLHQI